MRITNKVWLTAAMLAVAGCGAALQGSDPTPPPFEVDGIRSPDGIQGSIMDMAGNPRVGNVTIGSGTRGEALAGSVNRHLWRASLDTLAFLPITSTDPFTGIIATDWGAVTDADTERFRVTAFISDVALSPDSLRVAVFREVRGEAGTWVSAPVAAETPRQIEDSILVRARQLRLAERGAS